MIVILELGVVLVVVVMFFTVVRLIDAIFYKKG